MKLNFLFGMFLFVLIATTSCDLLDGDDVGGSQSPMGEVGNSFTTSMLPTGISNASASITNLNDGVSSVSYTATITNPTFTNLIKSVNSQAINGNTVSGEFNYKFTSKGIEAVYDDASLTLVKYDAKVGDKYTANHNGMTIKREVTEVSTEDDFYWGGMAIKTIAVEETGRGIPGVSKILYRYNHKFGLVNVKAFFEDGSWAGMLVYSDSNN